MVDGPNQYSGRVEVYNRNFHRTYINYPYPIFAELWGTICDSSLTVEDATVLCRSLGYHFNEADLNMSQSYGLGTGPIWTNYIRCSGSEYYMWQCSYRLNYGYRLPSCNHSMDIGITCSGTYVYRTWEKFGGGKFWRIWRMMYNSPKFSAPIVINTVK